MTDARQTLAAALAGTAPSKDAWIQLGTVRGRGDQIDYAVEAAREEYRIRIQARPTSAEADGHGCEWLLYVPRSTAEARQREILGYVRGFLRAAI